MIALEDANDMLAMKEQRRKVNLNINNINQMYTNRFDLVVIGFSFVVFIIARLGKGKVWCVCVCLNTYF